MFTKPLLRCVVFIITITLLAPNVSAQSSYYPPNAPNAKYRDEYGAQLPVRVDATHQRVPNNNRPPAGHIINNQGYNQPQGGVDPKSTHERMRGAPMRPNNVDGASSQKNKCRIWVPTETVDKYLHATKIQEDKSHQMEQIEICCTGYGPIRWRGSTLCKPLCENCRNGFCVAPGECECFEEFVTNDNGDCVFTCPLGCLNGHCYLDGTCQCDPGYKLDETRKFCRPICSTGCDNNPRINCTEPEVCSCAKGYQLTDEGCQPTCKPHCGPGGYCRDYNVCECDRGYTFKNGVCQADCYQ